MNRMNHSDTIDLMQVQQLLAAMQVGFWRMELPGQGEPRLYGDDALHSCLHADAALTPEELYRHWARNIAPGHRAGALQMLDALQQGQPADGKYLWRHPVNGWVWLRCGGAPEEGGAEGTRLKGWLCILAGEPEAAEAGRSLVSPEEREMLDAFYYVYSSIIELDLCTGQAYILKSRVHALEREALTIPQLYRTIVRRYHISEEKDSLKHFFKLSNLKGIAETQENFTLDFPAKEAGTSLKWKCIEALCVPQNKQKLYLTFCDVDEKHIMHSILKHFVFSDSDYLYYVDLNDNSFLNFCKSADDLLLPPQHGDDYIRAMTDYNKKYIAPAEQDRVTRQMMPDYMAKRLQSEDSYTIEAGMMDDDGNYSRKQVTIQNYDRENRTLFIIRKDVTKEYFRQKEQQKDLTLARRLANTDPLTGLCNRNSACAEIEKRLLNIQDEMDAFIILDLDNFKAVNDCLGHSQGDELLQSISKTLAESFRKTDIIARLGGDEFIIYMKDIKSSQTVDRSAEKLLGKLQASYPAGEDSVDVSASMGVALAPRDGICFEDLYVKSDKALYSAKRQGKNRYSFFAAEDGGQ